MLGNFFFLSGLLFWDRPLVLRFFVDVVFVFSRGKDQVETGRLHTARSWSVPFLFLSHCSWLIALFGRASFLLRTVEE